MMWAGLVVGLQKGVELLDINKPIEGGYNDTNH